MSIMGKYKGTCLCGKLRFEINGPIQDIVYCHCSLCRKAQGSAFATNGNVNITDFVFLSGEENLTGYESTPGQSKYFCKTCGSPIISKSLALPDKVRVRLGVVETDIDEKVGAHIFVGSKAVWEKIDGSLPQFEEYQD